MATNSVLGNSPISFFMPDKQVSIPLSALVFQDGQLQLADGSPFANELGSNQQFTNWLTYLAAQGVVVPAPTQPPAQALVFTAVDQGVTGNDVSVNVTYSQNTCTVTATKTDRYTGLTAGNIAQALSDQPGLVTLQTSNPSFTGFTGPDDLTVSMTPASPPATLPTATFSLDANNQLVLVPTKTGPDSSFPKASLLIQVTLSVKGAASGTFSLTAVWTKTVQIDPTKPGTWSASFGQLNYVVSVSAPPVPPGASIRLPQAGTYVLTGGSNTVQATYATATALANS